MLGGQSAGTPGGRAAVVAVVAVGVVGAVVVVGVGIVLAGAAAGAEVSGAVVSGADATVAMAGFTDDAGVVDGTLGDLPPEPGGGTATSPAAGAIAPDETVGPITFAAVAPIATLMPSTVATPGFDAIEPRRATVRGRSVERLETMISSSMVCTWCTTNGSADCPESAPLSRLIPRIDAPPAAANVTTPTVRLTPVAIEATRAVRRSIRLDSFTVGDVGTNITRRAQQPGLVEGPALSGSSATTEYT